MRRKPIKMHHTREVLCQKPAGTSNGLISVCLRIACSTVAHVIEWAAEAELTSPEAGALPDAALTRAMFNRGDSLSASGYTAACRAGLEGDPS